MKIFSCDKFQALDPRKRWLYLAWIVENWLAPATPPPSDSMAVTWEELFRRYVGCLPHKEKEQFHWHVLLQPAGDAPAWRSAATRLLDEVYAGAGYDRENLRHLFSGTAMVAPASRRVQPLRVVADGIRSPFNTGSIIRCAEAAGAEAVYLTGYTPGPAHRRVRRSAMSAENYLAVREMTDCLAALEQCRKQGYVPVALEKTAASVDYGAFPFPRPLALVVGNEELGIARPVLEACRHVIHIPMLGVKESLNVAQALAVVLFACIRHWREAGLVSYPDRE